MKLKSIKKERQGILTEEIIYPAFSVLFELDRIESLVFDLDLLRA